MLSQLEYVKPFLLFFIYTMLWPRQHLKDIGDKAVAFFIFDYGV